MEDLKELGMRPIAEFYGVFVTQRQLDFLRKGAKVLNDLHGKEIFRVAERPNTTYGDGTRLPDGARLVAFAGSWYDDGFDEMTLWSEAERIAELEQV